MRAFEHRKKSNPSSGTFFNPKIQKKLKTGTPGDRFETEADQVADQVVNQNQTGTVFQSKKEEEIQQKPLAETISSVQKQELKEEQPTQKKGKEEDKEPVQKKGKEEEKEPLQKKGKEEEKEPVQKKGKEEEKEPVQKKCDACEKEEKAQKKEEKDKPVQKREHNSSQKDSNDTFEQQLNETKGSGTGMDTKTREEMEQGFGADFSNVKIHTNSEAENMSSDIGAQAFTNGNDVYFNKGKYNPNSKEGKHLLAHELTHTIQQGASGKANGSVQKKAVNASHPEDLQAENPAFKGDYKLEKTNDGEGLIQTGSKGECVAKIQQGLTDLGYELPKFGVDGDFGSETRRAVIDFQSQEQLNSIDGIVGPETMGTLDNAVIAKGGKKDKKPPKCSKKKPTPFFSDTFTHQSSTNFFTESGCANTLFIKARDLHDNSDTGGCNDLDVFVDGKLLKTINLTTKDVNVPISLSKLAIGKHRLTLNVPDGCSAIVKASASLL